MLTIGRKTSEKVTHFSEICPDIPLPEQVKLRGLGNSYFERLAPAIQYFLQYVEKNPLLDEMLGPHFKEMKRAMETYGYVLDGTYYNDEQPNSQHSMIERNLAGDGMYISMMYALVECKKQDVKPVPVCFLSYENLQPIDLSGDKKDDDSSDNDDDKKTE